MLIFLNTNLISFFLELFSDSLQPLEQISSPFLWQVNMAVLFLPVQFYLSLRFPVCTMPYKYPTNLTLPSYCVPLSFNQDIPLVLNAPAVPQPPLIIKVLVFP